MNDTVTVECIPSGETVPMDILDDAMVFCPFCNKAVPFYAIKDVLAEHVIIPRDPQVKAMSESINRIEVPAN